MKSRPLRPTASKERKSEPLALATVMVETPSERSGSSQRRKIGRRASFPCR
jgi:hypothetical protein